MMNLVYSKAVYIWLQRMDNPKMELPVFWKRCQITLCWRQIRVGLSKCTRSYAKKQSRLAFFYLAQSLSVSHGWCHSRPSHLVSLLSFNLAHFGLCRFHPSVGVAWCWRDGQRRRRRCQRKREKCVDAGEERREIRKNLCGGWEEGWKKTLNQYWE